MKKTFLAPRFFLLLLVALFLSVGACSYVTGEALTAPSFPPVPASEIKDVSAMEAYAIIALNNGRANFTIIDVRTAAEYAARHIPRAINRDYNSSGFRDDINKFDKDEIYVIYCQTGVRGAHARDIMKELGFRYVYNISGGITAWIAQGLPVVK